MKQTTVFKQLSLPARTAREVRAVCNPAVPLVGEDLDALHEDLSPLRSGVDILEKSLRGAFPEQFQVHLVSGPPGSGKTTELQWLVRELHKSKEDRSFHALYIGGESFLGVRDVHLADFLVMLFAALGSDATLAPIVSTLPGFNRLWSMISGWFQGLGVEVASVSEIGPTLRMTPSLARGFRALSDRATSSLLEGVGELLGWVQAELLGDPGFRQLMLIVDDLDQFEQSPSEQGWGQEDAELLFLRQLPLVRRLPVHLVLTVPPRLLSEGSLRHTLEDAIEVMLRRVPVHARGAPESPAESGVEALRRLLARRIDLDVVFADERAQRHAIVCSGGHLADLLGLVSETALQRGGVGFTTGDIDAAVQVRVNRHERLLQGSPFLFSLHAIAGSGAFPDSLVEEDRRWLLEAGVVLEYGQPPWFDVHPFTKKTRTFQESKPSDTLVIEQIEQVALHQLRSVVSFEMTAAPPASQEGQWVVLLGDNGAGKTTVLRGIALALCGWRDGSLALLGLRAPQIRHGAKEATCRVKLAHGEFSAVVKVANNSEYVGEGNLREACWVVGYGCRRGSALGGRDQVVSVDIGARQALGSLFDDEGGLVNARAWLRERQHKRATDQGVFDAVLAALQSILKPAGVEGVMADDDDIWCTGERIGGRIRLEGMSDGFVTMAGWVVDLIARWVTRREALGRPVPRDFLAHMTGVVLIDEIDLHLHPSWQRRVIRDVRAIFPKLTFVVTTHSAMTLLGARNGEIFRLQPEDGGKLLAYPLDLPPGIRVDQVLTGPWFGLPSALPDEALAKLEAYQRLLEREVPEQDEERQRLEAELRSILGSFADTWEERVVREVVAAWRKEEGPVRTPEQEEQLKARALERLKQRRAQRSSGQG